VIRTMPPAVARARAVVEPGLRTAVARLSPDLRRLTEYHFGWIDVDGKPADGGGKGVRPALVVLSAEAVGAPPAVAVPGAVALELVHNFSLIHDDVIDGDRERRHRPTVWALYGIGSAVVGGDALLTLAVDVLLEAPGPHQVRATRRLTRATAEMIDGQVDDMAFEARRTVSVDECIAMEAKKTGALLACAASIGAALTGADDGVVEALARYGLELGLSFQAIDDLLGIWGAPEITGKPVGSDLQQRKKSLPVAIALASSRPEADELAHLLGNGEMTSERVVRAAQLVEACGGREGTDELAKRHLDAALAALAEVELASAARDELVEVAHFVTVREF
jgi:geranylgeranyl diphosphate synthase type I